MGLLLSGLVFIAFSDCILLPAKILLARGIAGAYPHHLEAEFILKVSSNGPETRHNLW